MAQIFAAFGKFQQNNKGSIQNFGIIGVTIGSEELMKFIFFYCPCNYPMNQVYGSTFIWGPAAILLVVGYVINRRTWRLMTGMCNRTQGVGKGGKRIFHFIFIFANISMKAILAPATWIVISFLKGDYYACAAWPGPNDPTAAAKFDLPPNTTIPKPCHFREKPIYFKATSAAEVIARDLRAYSHIIGWWFLTWAVLLGIFMVFVFRCLSKYSYEQSKYIEKYRSSEMELFDEALDAKAKAQAKIAVDQFFSKPRSKEEWDQIASINDKVMKSKRGRPIYSPLHKFSNKELVALELAQDDIVTSAAQKKRHLSDFVRKKKLGTKSANPTKGAPAKTASLRAAPNSSGGGAAPAATVIPMVTMAPAPRVVVKPPHTHPTTQPQHQQTPSQHTPGDQNKNNPTQTQEPAAGPASTFAPTTTPQTTEVEAEVSPSISPGQRPPSYQSSVEDDPIEEANAPKRSSLVMPAMDDDEDPIREANIAEQAEEIRRSMQELDVDVDDEGAPANGMGQTSFQDYEAQDDDSAPLL